VQTAVPYVLAVVISYGGDRLLRFIWSVIPFTATLVRLKMGKVVQIRFPKHPIAKAFGLYKTGQYVFLNFPQLSLFQWHPFSISSGPDEVTGEVHIKGLGGHTMELVERCGKPEGKLWVRVDGPYVHARSSLATRRLCCGLEFALDVVRVLRVGTGTVMCASTTAATPSCVWRRAVSASHPLL
jgi:predicted ferric reductase